MSKLLLFFCLLSFSSSVLIAGNFGVGIMVGANSALNSFDTKAPVTSFDSKLGFNANAFARIKFAGIVVQPELGYFYNRGAFKLVEGTNPANEVTLNLGELYASALIGFKFSKLRIMLGPLGYSTAVQNFSNLATNSQTISSLATNSDIKWGGQFGVGIDMTKKLFIDARIQKLFTNTAYEAKTSSTSSSFSGSLGSVSLSLGYSFLKM